MLNEMHPEGVSNDACEVTSFFFRSADGLNLHAREYRPRGGSALTSVVCLPGLTRSEVDFAVLARALASSTTAPRRILAFDCRGRGRSDHASDWRQYDLATEIRDLLAGLQHAGVAAAHFVGTSRGGLQVMALALHHRELIRAVVLNDIGPVIETEGLARIRTYVGRGTVPGSIDEAVAQLKRSAGLHFAGLSDDEWRYFARTTFGDGDELRVRYDPALARALEALDLTRGVPPMWSQYDALVGAPLLVIRGESSDLLSVETFDAMAARWPGCQGWTVPGQGHAPLLADAPTLTRIHDFLRDAGETNLV